MIPLIINRHHREREKRMSKAKTKTRAVQPTGDGPTAERMTRDGWETIAAPKLADEDWRTRNATARKVACRVTRMYRDGWFDEDGYRAVLGYQTLIERVGRDRGKSCLDFTGGSGGESTLEQYHRHIANTDRLSALDCAVSLEVGMNGLALVRAVLGPYGMETIGDVAERMRPGASRDSRMDWARDVFGASAALLARYVS